MTPEPVKDRIQPSMNTRSSKIAMYFVPFVIPENDASDASSRTMRRTDALVTVVA
jgi:hypothetical protein